MVLNCHLVKSYNTTGLVVSFLPYPITRRQILDSSKFKDFADDNFKCDKNGRKLYKQVENTVGKGEIARYERFLLFLRCFQKGRQRCHCVEMG